MEPLFDTCVGTAGIKDHLGVVWLVFSV
jgi:hypothetical protein